MNLAKFADIDGRGGSGVINRIISAKCGPRRRRRMNVHSQRKSSMTSSKKISAYELSKNGQPEEFALVILGGGTGGTVAAWASARRGLRVAVIERKYVGGSCPNIACLPSKRDERRSRKGFAFCDSSEVIIPPFRQISRIVPGGLPWAIPWLLVRRSCNRRLRRL
jgi:hypothetical protein